MVDRRDPAPVDPSDPWDSPPDWDPLPTVADRDAVERTVQALVNAAQAWGSPPTAEDMTRAFVLTLRYVRDHLAIRGLIYDDSDITAEINMWIWELSDEDSVLGDALEVPKPSEQIFAWVTVDDDDKLTPDSTITLNGQTWPVPHHDRDGSSGRAARIDEALSGRGWHVLGYRDWDLGHPGVVGIPLAPGERDPSEPPF
jgi:hypothetical protein